MAIAQFQTLPNDLSDMQIQIEEYARSYGLDFYTTIFEVVGADQLNAIAAYGGFPTRYPHWRFGMEYERLSKGYHYGLQKIYELVINNDPCYAYLMKANALVDQKLVMAHVYGHCDFFKNNQWFSQTNRKMMDEMANHGNRIRRYMDRFGVNEVEDFIDSCLSIEDLIDIHSPFIRRREQENKYDFSMEPGDEPPAKPGRFQAKNYMDSFVNPPEVLKYEAVQKEEDRKKSAEQFPPKPARDVMLFLLEYAPLSAWQTDILAMFRDEAYYFAPQAQTKIMNEGWASYWHSTIMTQHGLEPSEVISYCDHHAGTMATAQNRLNPYKLGIELFRDIEERWNRGQFGREYESCDDRVEKAKWDTQAGLGREKIFEVRKIYNDLTFVDTFLTLEFCRKHKLFKFGYNTDTNYYEIESRAFPKIKQQLLFNLTNASRPHISVVDGNFKNRGELFLHHEFTGVELQISYAHDTLVNVHRLWNRPVHIETVLDDTVVLLSYDGSEHKLKKGE